MLPPHLPPKSKIRTRITVLAKPTRTAEGMKPLTRLQVRNIRLKLKRPPAVLGDKTRAG
jgi:hypothetical protein